MFGWIVIAVCAVLVGLWVWEKNRNIAHGEALKRFSKRYDKDVAEGEKYARNEKRKFGSIH